MRAAWRLALAALSARRVRTILLVCAVAMSAALIAAVSCALASANRGLERQLEVKLGRADVRLRPAGRGMVLPERFLNRVESWDGVAAATPMQQRAVSVRFNLAGMADLDGDGVFEPTQIAPGSSAMVIGSPAGRAGQLDLLELIDGRRPESSGEVVIDALLAERLTARRALQPAERSVITLSRGDVGYLDHPEPDLPPTAAADEAEEVNERIGVRVGDTISVVRFLRSNVDLTVVGIARPPPLGGRPHVYTDIETVSRVASTDPGYTAIEITLAEGVDPDAFVAAHEDDLGDAALLTTTERITSGVDRNMTSSQIAFTLVSMLAFLSSAFIIMTGLTTGIAEQQRALAVVRCIGATRAQLGLSQLLNGAIIGVLGAVLGVPLGVFLAWALTVVFHERIPNGLSVNAFMLAAAGFGAIAAGVLGACWPAWQSARMSPLAGLSARARPATARGVIAITLAGLAGLAIMIGTVAGPRDGQVVFWGYVTTGLPAMMLGYFLMGVPVVHVMARVLSPVLTRLFRLPPSMLQRTIAQTPYRHGFTAGAMMVGLAMMVVVWTNGGAFLRDWLQRIEFPDAFVSGLALPPEAQAKIEALPQVTGTCAISLHPVETDAFGVRGLTQHKTTFVAFDPDAFFEQTAVEFVQGDAETARRRLNEGSSVIVAREFLVAKGMGVGDTFNCRGADGELHQFEIVGVVTSPGLELISKFFNVGDEFVEQAVHGVFGSRADLKRTFGAEAIQLIQVGLDPDADDMEAVGAMQRELFGMGVLDAGSGRKIKNEFVTFVKTNLLVVSSIAVGSMLIACFGVANLVAAGIHARRFELGVLRAVGGSRGLLARLIGAEAVVVAVTACLIGTAMGIQSAWAERVMLGHIIGLDLRFSLPVIPILAGWTVVMVLTVGAALPAVGWLNRRRPRELLAAGR